MTQKQKIDHYLHSPALRIAIPVFLVVSLVALGWCLHPDSTDNYMGATPTSMLLPVPAVTVTLPARVVTHTLVKRIPGPTRTVVKYVSRSSTRTPVAPRPGGVAACIRKWESGGDYTAQNPASTASGAYQFLDSTWRAVTGLSGRAKNYSPATQDAAFIKLWAGGAGRSQWVTSYHC